MVKILLTEDDIDFANVLKHYLELNNYSVTVAENGEMALKILKNELFDICILDVMMPKMDGFVLAEKIAKANSKMPFVFLTAKALKEDKIKGLKLGADDYIVKPFETDELLLRLNNILKRSQQKLFVNKEEKEITIGKYSFNTQKNCLTVNNTIHHLSEKESALIYFLYINKNKIIKREQILKAVWKNDDFFSGRSMDVFISKIRKYFAEDEKIKIESKRFIGLEFKIIE